MKGFGILLGLSTTLAAVIPPQHPLQDYNQPEISYLSVESKASNIDTTIRRKERVVNSEDRGLSLDESQQWSGYLKLGNNTDLSFWISESRNDPADDPVILWLSGDPGIPATCGALERWGPKRILNDGSFTKNPAALNEAATVIFLDHLVGAGSSHATPETAVDSTSKATTDVLQFIEAFFRTSFGGKTFSGRDFHIGGEYYAGHYLPSIARAIVSRPPEDRFNLKSVMIGNGWFDALTQQMTIYQQLCDAELTSNLDRMLGDDQCDLWLTDLRKCEESIIECREDVTQCSQLEEKCSHSDAQNYDNVRFGDHSRFNDFRHCETLRHHSDRGGNNLVDGEGSLDVDFERCKDERGTLPLDKPSILKSLKDSGDYTRDSIPDLSSILSTAEPAVRVLLYAGTENLKAPYLGTKAVAKRIEWAGHHAFNEATKAPHYAELKSSDGDSHGEYVKVSHAPSRTLMSFGLYGAGNTADEKTGVKVKALLYRWIFDHHSF